MKHIEHVPFYAWLALVFIVAIIIYQGEKTYGHPAMRAYSALKAPNTKAAEGFQSPIQIATYEDLPSGQYKLAELTGGYFMVELIKGGKQTEQFWFISDLPAQDKGISLGEAFFK